jgi:hypothetical protein
MSLRRRKVLQSTLLYGGVGLGKTHLLHAIGQYVASQKKAARVGYVSSEKFTNEYIDGIQNNQLARFRKRYRQTDVLLIDDIQFRGKERIQENSFTPLTPCRSAQANRADLRPAGERDPESGAPAGFTFRVGAGYGFTAARRGNAPGHSQEKSPIDGCDTAG